MNHRPQCKYKVSKKNFYNFELGKDIVRYNTKV